MIKFKHRFYAFLFMPVFVVIVLTACNNNKDDIPFPGNEFGNAQPVTVPLVFTPEKKLNWDTASESSIQPVVKKFDIDALPAIPYDTSGFKPFAQPEETKFDFNSLPEVNLDMEKLPSISLQFKTSILAQPTSAKAAMPVAQKDKPISIFDFGQAQGLQSKFVSCLVKDKTGLMWIATNQSIFRYDGTYIQTIIPPVDNKIIFGMVEDNNGKMWYVDAEGIGVIDPKTNTLAYSKKLAFEQNRPTDMFKDEKGFIWLNNKTAKGVSIIDPETNTFKTLDERTGLSDSSVYDIIEDNDKNIWISTSTKGINILNLKSGKIKYFKKANGLRSDTLSAMTKDKNGQVWISDAARYGSGDVVINIKKGTASYYERMAKNGYRFHLFFDNKGLLWKPTSRGLEIMDVDRGTSRIIDQDKGLAGNVVIACIADDYNRMWVATNKGLNIIDQNAETVHTYNTINVTSIMEDAAGNLWVATQKGLVIINAKRNEARALNTSNGLSNDFVQSFTKFKDKMIVNTNGGYNIIDPVNKTISKIGKDEGLINDTIYNSFIDKSGNLWLTGPSNGINMYDSVKHIMKHAGIPGGLSDDNIADIRQDKDGLLWLATFTNGVDVINLKTGTIKFLKNTPGLKDTCNKVLLNDKYGRMWIGTDKGIYIADTKQGTLTTITTKEGLTHNHILSLLEYKGGVIAGTSNKISIVTAPIPAYAGEKDTTTNQWKIKVLDKSEGLIKQNNSWASDCITAKGEYLWGDLGITAISSIKPAVDSVNTYVTGITVMTQPQYFKNNYAFKENDTLRAADTFYVKGQQPVNNVTKGLSWDSVSAPYNMPVNLHIPYNDNYLQFQFAQANLSSRDTTRYSYFLQGIDQKWSAATANQFTENYLNLPPGNYTFKVCSKGIGGQWSAPATFSFTISPPWYKTWWAYTLFALIGIGILRGYIVYRSRRLQKENKILEEKINLRTSQLQKSIEDLKATQTQLVQSEKMASLGELTAGIAHEIQNPLNFINNFSEVNTELIDEMQQEIDKGNLEEVRAIANDIQGNEQKINHHGKRADGIVKGMLQHSRSSNGIKESTNINTLADEYLRLSYHGLRAKDKAFNATMATDFDETIENINIVPQDIGRVILNLITNAFYAVTEKKKSPHPLKGGKEYEPVVTVTTKRLSSPSGVGGKIQISVQDNGNGIPQKVLDKIFQPFFTTKPTGEGTGLGLSLSYDIIKAHGGEIKVETKEGEGTTFIIQLPVS